MNKKQMYLYIFAKNFYTTFTELPPMPLQPPTSKLAIFIILEETFYDFYIFFLIWLFFLRFLYFISMDAVELVQFRETRRFCYFFKIFILRIKVEYAGPRCCVLL